MTRLWLAAACAAAVSGCGGGVPKRVADFTAEVRGYNEGVRWANFSSAALRLPPLEREAFLDEREALAEDLRIVDYEVLRVRFRDDRRRARVDVEFTWHLDSRGIVHKTVTRQQWELHGKAWWMVEERRVRGAAMPGVDEPDELDEGDPDEPDAPEDAETASRRRN